MDDIVHLIAGLNDLWGFKVVDSGPKSEVAQNEMNHAISDDLRFSKQGVSSRNRFRQRCP